VRAEINGTDGGVLKVHLMRGGKTVGSSAPLTVNHGAHVFNFYARESVLLYVRISVRHTGQAT
jgi:hypothetical protein